MSWPSIPLGELLIDAQPGFASGKSDPDGVLQVRMNNVKSDGSWDWSKKRRVPATDNQLKRYTLIDGDILFNATNSPEQVGKSALFKNNGEAVTFSNHFLRLRVEKKKVDATYIARYLTYLNGRAIFQSMVDAWVNQATVQRDSFMAISVPVPPLHEQKRIAAILDKADGIRRKRQEAIDVADQFLRSVFLDMFGDPVSNQKKFRIGKIRELLASVNYGTSSKADVENGQYPILRMGNITYEGKLDFSDLKYIDLDENEKDRYTARRGDLLFNRTNSKELVGKTAVFESDRLMAIAGYLIRARTNFKANPHYISAYLNSSHGKKALRNMCKSIVGMANINAQELQDIKILCPPRELQDEYEKVVIAINARVLKMNFFKAHSEELFQSLSQKAFAGNL